MVRHKKYKPKSFGGTIKVSREMLEDDLSMDIAKQLGVSGGIKKRKGVDWKTLSDVPGWKEVKAKEFERQYPKPKDSVQEAIDREVKKLSYG